MRKVFYLVSFILLASSFLFADTWSQSTISANTTWTKNNASGDGVWIVDVPNDTLIVEAGATLTIEAGVTVKFHDDVLFLVYGSLIAEGNAQDSIIFTLDDAPGSATEWSGIKLLSGASTVNKLIYCRIEKGDADIDLSGGKDYENNGGGIFCAASIDSNTVIKHCTIQHNKAVEGGGGIFTAGAPKIEFNLIRHNIAGQYGGGIGIKGGSVFELATPTLKNNIIIHNKADGLGGGGIGSFANTNMTMLNDLVYDNSSLNGSGGGIFLYSSSSLLSGKNLIVRGNSANSSNQIFGVPDLTYSNVEGGYSGEGNIDADPQFKDAANDDFHFEANSPLVDAGDNINAPNVDFDGEPRPFDGDRDGTAVADMGPYEYQNTPPQIVSQPVTQATEDQLYTYQVVAEDPDAEEVLTYALLQGPAFLSMDAATGLLSGTPQTDEEAGDYTVVIQVSDLNNATDTQTFTLTVVAVNDAPIVSDIPDQTIDEGQSFTQIYLDNYVEDEDNADSEMTWTYSGNLQLIVTIDENRVATIQTPDSDWYGSETITFTATDPGGLSGSDAATFTVNNVNDAPVVSDIPDQTIDEGQSFTQIYLDDYVTDIDNVESDLTWTYSGNQELIVTIDENRVATISTPNTDWYGSETITFTATDPGGLSDSDPATFTVNAVNDAPVVSDIPDQTIDEGQSFVSIALDDYVTDVDNDKSELTWTYSGNQDLIVVISADHIATVSVPDSDWFGAETITFRATDPDGAYGEDAATFTVNNINDAPVAVDDNATTSEDVAATIDVLANDSDVDGDNLLVSTVSSPTYGTAVIDNNQVIYTPETNWSGNDSFTYTIVDGNGGSAQATVYVTVEAVNDAPVVSDIPDQTISEGETFSDIVLDNYVNDVDNADSEITWTYSGNQDLQVSISADRVAHIAIPDPDWNGSEQIVFTATDPGGLSDHDTVTFTVQPVNDPPLAVDDHAATSEDSSLHIAVLQNDSDAENNPLTITQILNLNHGTASIVADTLIKYTPAANYYGDDSFQYVVSDNNGGLDTGSVFVTISPVNDPPMISGLNEQQTNEGQAFEPIELDAFVSDVDDPDSVLQWQASATQNIAVSISNDRVLTAQPVDENWYGSEIVVLTVTDTSGAMDQDSVKFTVLPVNDAPVAINDTASVAEDSSLVIALLENDFDIDGDSLQIAAIDSALHGRITLANNRLTYSPFANFFGEDSLSYVVSDGNGALDTAKVLITVTPVNDAPVVIQMDDQIIMEGQSFDVFALDNYVSDVDDPDSLLSWSVKGQTELSATITPQRFLFVEPPSSEWNGSELLTLTVVDTAGLADSMTVKFEVLAVNDTVSFSLPLPTLTFKEDDSLLYDVSNWYPYVEDKDNPDSTLNFDLTGAKVVTVVKKDHAFLLKAPTNWFGSDTLTLTVDDGLVGNSTSVLVNVKAVNDAPEIRNLPSEITFDNDTTYVLTMKDFAFDIDTPDSLLSWNFMVSNDSLKFSYDTESTNLTLSAPQFAGTVHLTCILSDDSSATVRDTIEVVVTSPTGLQDDLFSQIPKSFELRQNFPNPFNPLTKIRFGLPRAGKISITVYNILGKKVATVFEGYKPAGYHVVTFNGSHLASGIYFYRLTTEDGKAFIRKMVLLK